MAENQTVAGRTVSRRTALATLAGAGTVALAGCGDVLGSDGDVVEASGSNTVRPLTEAVGEAYEDENEGAVIEVRGPGTGAGFEEFSQGDTDLQNASRDISDEEASRADENGIEYTQFEVGQDALTVYLNVENEFVDYLHVDELQAIYDFESDVERWSDVRDEWPDEEMDIWGRDSDSGTFDYFTNVINGEAGRVRTDYSDRTETASVVEGVASNEFAIGFGGYSFLVENQDVVRAAPIQDRGDTEPTPVEVDEISAGNYTPLTRPLFVFANHDSLEREVVEDFMRFYFDEVADIAPRVNFFGAPPDVLEGNHDALDDIVN